MTDSVFSAAGRIRRWREHPDDFVRDNFRVEPDDWQLEVLQALPICPRIAMKACKGPGKTALLAWVIWWMLVCFPHPKIACTSITADNLKDGLWTELAKWRNVSPLLTGAFTWTKTRIYANDHPETWWCSARSWAKGANKEAQSDTLAGLHADFLMFLIDEAGGVPDAVMAAAEAGLANAGIPTADGKGVTKAWLLIAGNPTHLEGPLYRACSSERSLWKLVEITGDPDAPNRSKRISVEWARAQIAKYGADNPWVLVNVFGKFPPSSINALLGPDDLSAAIARVIRREDLAGHARILGVDVARFGLDSSSIARRQGRVLLPLLQKRNLDSIQGAGWVARIWRDVEADQRRDEHERRYKADACFVDASGGYGVGWIDQLSVINLTAIGVSFAGKADDPRYFNKRTEMHWRAAEWIKSGGKLPNDPELVEEALAHTYTFRGDKLWVEEKEQVKEKIGRSPDKWDAFVLTFAYDVAAAPQGDDRGEGGSSGEHWSPGAVQDSYLSQADRNGDPYNPFGANDERFRVRAYLDVRNDPPRHGRDAGPAGRRARVRQQSRGACRARVVGMRVRRAEPRHARRVGRRSAA